MLQAAYLALTQLLDHSNNLVLLLVNTLLSDLKSDNFINGGGGVVPGWRGVGRATAHIQHARAHIASPAAVLDCMGPRSRAWRLPMPCQQKLQADEARCGVTGECQLHTKEHGLAT